MITGRSAEIAVLERLLESVRNGASGRLVVRGEAGSGKSALLRLAAEMAVGMRVLSAVGLESESEIAFAGLHDVLKPILHRLGAIPDPQADSLAGALALGPPVAQNRFAVCVATLSLIAVAAEEAPLLVLVDDVQWLDSASAEALTFAARRLDAEPAAILFAVRDGETPSAALGGLPEMLLAGLDDPASRELLFSSTEHPIAPHVVEQLVHATAGNPMALVTSPRLLTAAQLAGRDALDEPLPIAPTLRRAFARRLARLPGSTRQALQVAAACESDDADAVFAALGQTELSSNDLDPAEAAGLVAMERGRLRFEHPLLRATVYHEASPSQRRAAHSALARALTDEASSARRAWHLALAADMPDDEVASRLEQAALLARERTGYAAAARALEKAAELTPGRDRRILRYVDAARTAHLGGLGPWAMALLDEALKEGAAPNVRSQIQLLRGQIGMWISHPMKLHHLLLAEAGRCQAVDPNMAAELMAVAAIPCLMAGEGALAIRTAEGAHVLATGRGRPSVAVATALTMVRSMTGDYRDGATSLEEAAERLMRDGHWWTTPAAHFLTAAAIWAEQWGLAESLMVGIIDAARETSALALLPYALTLGCELEHRRSDLTSARVVGTEAVQLAVDTGAVSLSAYCLVCLARVEALQGRAVDCRGHVAHALELVGEHGTHVLDLYAMSVLGLLELGTGNADGAVTHLRQERQLALDRGFREPNMTRAGPDLVEACFLSGRLAEAGEVLSDLESQSDRTGGVWAQAAVARCRGLLARSGDESDFEAALDLHDSAGGFELARTRLRYGQVLRRRHARARARPLLKLAHEAFASIGAEPWTAQASRELAACGERVPSVVRSAVHELTPQELQICRLVAGGATNREVASQLFLSQKTVEAHLSRAYLKLQVRSRTELANLMAQGHREPET